MNNDITLYIGNLAPEVDEKIIYELLVQISPIRKLKLPKDRVLRKHLGYCFVELDNPTSCEYAEKLLNGLYIYNRPIKVKRSIVDKQNKLITEDNVLGTKLFLGNLDRLVDEKYLVGMMKNYGVHDQLLKPPEIKRDIHTGESMGYGILNFRDFETCDLVIKKLNGQFLMNKKVKVEYAKKSNGKSYHGDKSERLLASKAEENYYHIRTDTSKKIL
ncbi:hypothetical protein LJB42_004117 [Komagataella kurtzmanii]|nr:hypothetical protein LJB42_004117 [Komagataella kurtzmanii]